LLRLWLALKARGDLRAVPGAAANDSWMLALVLTL